MGNDEYRIPFFVRAARNSPRSDIVFVASTTTYLAYANSRQAAELIYGATGDVSFLDEVYRTLLAHPEVGLSGYDIHADGTPRRYMSRLRPLIDMQPGVTKTWSFQADTLILAWLERSGYRFDVITDEDLHRDGAGALDGYRLAITGSHPEYASSRILDAFEAHLVAGGRLMYMGGNGFYMRVAFSDALPGAMEMRRVSQSLAGLWNEAPGQHYFSFTGELAGLWENLGRPLQAMAGVGFADLMTGTELTYELTSDARSPRAAFIMQGVEGPITNPYGTTYGLLCSDEFDRFDPQLGSPRHGLVIAKALRKPAVHPFDKDLCADMTFFETPGGGAVFATASISWSLGLNRNCRNNAIAQVTRNVVDRFLDSAAFKMR
jgi:N,N-dimethylformamidase